MKCPHCGSDNAVRDEYGDLDCETCDEIHESVVSPLREMPEENLKRLAAMMCPVVRVIWPGESADDARIRQYVGGKIAHAKREYKEGNRPPIIHVEKSDEDGKDG